MTRARPAHLTLTIPLAFALLTGCEESASRPAHRQAPARSSPEPAPRDDAAAVAELRAYLRDNFEVPGMETSWYPSILEVRLAGDTAEAVVALTSGDPRLPGICSGLSGFVYATPNRHLGLRQVRVVGEDGEVLLHRRSVDERCG